MVEKAIQQLRRLGSRAEAMGRCPVCGETVKAGQDPIRAWAGKYAHRGCGTYVKRADRARGGAHSHRVHTRFTGG